MPSDAITFDQAIQTIRTHDGRTIAELSAERPVLIVFLRHSGCTFCREALRDLQQQRQRIEQSGASIALVHLITDEEAARFFAPYGLDDVPRFSDPDRQLYAAFDLQRGTFLQLMGPRVVWRGIQSLLSGHGLGFIRGDVRQLPGTFVIHRGKIVRAFRNPTAADRPEYADMACAVPK